MDQVNLYKTAFKQVKPEGPAVPLKVMMMFLLHLYVYFYGFTCLLLNSDWLKSLRNKQTGTLL